MIKFALIALVLALLCRWALGRWPWEFLKGPRTTERTLARARRLLGVGPNAGEDEVRAAHRRLAAAAHPDRGGSDARLAEINAARDLLLRHGLPKLDIDS